MSDVNDDAQRVMDEIRARSKQETDSLKGESERYFLQYKIEGSTWRRYGIGFEDSAYAQQMLGVVKRDAAKDKSALAAPARSVSWRLIVETAQWRVVEN